MCQSRSPQGSLEWQFQDVELHTSPFAIWLHIQPSSWSKWVQRHRKKEMPNVNTGLVFKGPFRM